MSIENNFPIYSNRITDLNCAQPISPPHSNNLSFNENNNTTFQQKSFYIDHNNFKVDLNLLKNNFSYSFINSDKILDNLKKNYSFDNTEINNNSDDLTINENNFDLNNQIKNNEDLLDNNENTIKNNLLTNNNNENNIIINNFTDNKNSKKFELANSQSTIKENIIENPYINSRNKESIIKDLNKNKKFSFNQNDNINIDKNLNFIKSNDSLEAFSNMRYDDNDFNEEPTIKNPTIRIHSNYKTSKNNFNQIEISMEMIEQNRKNIQNVKLNYKKFIKLFNKNSLFHIFKFLDNNEIQEILKLNKHIRFLFNTILRNVYFNKIIPKLRQFKNHFQILKSKIHYSKIKNKLKIDLITNIRFISNNYNNNNDEDDNNFEPINISLLYAYNYFNIEKKNDKIQNKIIKSKIYDFYSFDIFSDKNNSFPSIYMIREFTSFNLDMLQKTYIQPVLPFKLNDIGEFVFNIFSPEKNFINPSEINIKIKKNFLNNKIYKEKSSELNPRVCEYEDICLHWKNLDNFKDKDVISDQLEKIFMPKFKIIRILYDDIGYLIFKIFLKANILGYIKNNIELGIEFLIKDSNEIINNEIKKNDLLFENKNLFELRKDDIIVFYFTTNK